METIIDRYSSHINNLPHECLDLILYYLPGKINRGILSLVCKKWRNATKRIPRMIVYGNFDNKISMFSLLLYHSELRRQLIRDVEIFIFNGTNRMNKTKRRELTIDYHPISLRDSDNWDRCLLVTQAVIHGYPLTPFSTDDIKFALTRVLNYNINVHADRFSRYNGVEATGINYDDKNALLSLFIDAVKGMDIHLSVTIREFLNAKKHGFHNVKIGTATDVDIEYMFSYYSVAGSNGKFDSVTGSNKKHSLMMVDMLPYLHYLPPGWLDTFRESFYSPYTCLSHWPYVSVSNALRILKRVKKYGDTRFLQESTAMKMIKNNTFSPRIMKLMIEISPLQDRMILLELLILLVRKKYIKEARELIAVNDCNFTDDEINNDGILPLHVQELLSLM